MSGGDVAGIGASDKAISLLASREASRALLSTARARLGKDSPELEAAILMARKILVLADAAEREPLTSPASQRLTSEAVRAAAAGLEFCARIGGRSPAPTEIANRPSA